MEEEGEGIPAGDYSMRELDGLQRMRPIIWYYREIVTALRTGWTHKLIDELEQVVTQLAELAKQLSIEGGWKDGIS